MSQLQQVKQALQSISQGSKQAGSNLAQFSRQFNQQSQRVAAVIGGSAQRKDQEVIQALTEASKAVQQAQQALETASKVASSYGQSL